MPDDSSAGAYESTRSRLQRSRLLYRKSLCDTMESFASSRAAVPYTFAIWECSKCVEFTWTECTRKNAASEWWPIRKFYRRMKKQLKIFHRCGVAFTSLCLSITKRRNHASSTGESTFIANSDSGIHGINSTPKLPRRVKSTSGIVW